MATESNIVFAVRIDTCSLSEPSHFLPRTAQMGPGAIAAFFPVTFGTRRAILGSGQALYGCPFRAWPSASSVHNMGSSSPGSFNDLFLRHQRDVFAYIVTMVPNRVDAEDIFQETCLKLLENAELFDPERKFFPWACGFALNQVRKFRRSHGRERWQFDDAVLESLAEVQVESSGSLEERLQLLVDCLAKLPAEKRELLLACYGCQGSLNDLAIQFGIEPPTLRKRLERIRRTLFECIQGES
jgi:RNA polymerase sigma-70 factor, ECF subfamily